LAGALPHTLLEELTALPQNPELDLRGPTSKGREGRKDGREGKQWRRGAGKRTSECSPSFKCATTLLLKWLTKDSP